MRIEVREFGGMRPMQSADLLPPGQAQLALDTRLTSGELRALKGTTDQIQLSGVPQVVSIYRYGQSISSTTQYWFQFTGDTDVVKGPVNGDTEERTYWTDGTYPKKTKSDIATTGSPYPSASLRMGLPAPTAPTVSVSGVATNPSDPGEAVNFVLTYVSAWGEEGPPSLPSNTVTWRAGQTLNVASLATAPGGAYNVTAKRLYRAATGTTDTRYQLTSLSDIAIATTTYNDTLVTASLGDAIVTTGWIAPPDNMIGLCSMAGGVMAGFFGSTICLSEPNAPYAWPARYQQSVDSPIVGIASFDQSLVIGTTQGMYVLTGIDPSSMTLDKLALAQSCVSKRSMVSMMGGVVWAAPDGLFFISAAGVKNLTEDLMARADWQAYNPSSILGAESDGRYIAFYDNGTKASMVFEFGSKPSFSRSSIYAYAAFRDKKADALFVIRDTGNHLASYDTGSALTYEWTSGVSHLPSEVNMACARVDASAYPVTFKLYADGALKHTQSVANKYAFRLPAGYRSQRYYVDITGTADVREVGIATTMEELTSA